MARSRIIRPEFPKDVKLARLSIPHRHFYALLWMELDRGGLCEYAPLLLKAATFPFDEDVTAETIEQWVADLVANGQLRMVEYKGQRYVYCPSLLKHQYFHPREQKRFDVPDSVLNPRKPRQGGIRKKKMVEPGSNPGLTLVLPSTLFSSSLSLSPSFDLPLSHTQSRAGAREAMGEVQGQVQGEAQGEGVCVGGDEGKGSLGTETGTADFDAEAAAFHAEPAFEQAFALYPNDREPSLAFEVFKRRIQSHAAALLLTQAVLHYGESVRGKAARYVKSFANFLEYNGVEPWRDYIDPPKPAPALVVHQGGKAAAVPAPPDDPSPVLYVRTEANRTTYQARTTLNAYLATVARYRAGQGPKPWPITDDAGRLLDDDEASAVLGIPPELLGIPPEERIAEA